jgi:hypothetical protein
VGCSRLKFCLCVLCPDYELVIEMKVLDLFNVFPTRTYLLLSKQYFGSYEYLKIAFSFVCQFHCFSAESVQGHFKEP